MNFSAVPNPATEVHYVFLFLGGKLRDSLDVFFQTYGDSLKKDKKYCVLIVGRDNFQNQEFLEALAPMIVRGRLLDSLQTAVFYRQESFPEKFQDPNRASVFYLWPWVRLESNRGIRDPHSQNLSLSTMKDKFFQAWVYHSPKLSLEKTSWAVS